ncbi:MAG: PVC-type heme-binding CxxCH protein [Verrucomicrobiota bacterium]|nr:PVC-type heme-binding CxxCH protein [Verrucomicrobiota bacterium]
MKAFLTLLTALAVHSISLSGQNASGIKTSNLVGADLDLMNNHDPASQLENFELLPGYEVNLFAANPMFANPVHMVWDSRGRLWVACSWAYPQIKPGDVANDKIIILEDTDNDGVADKSTVFADGLYLPTGIELANGGCYVGQSPDVLFLKDTDGDDVADVRQLALTGFGIEDNHHSISAWRRGPGGWIYFQEGIFLHAQVETQYGVVRNFNGGVYQFNPRTQELRMFCRGTGGNPWGHVFDHWGQSFMVNNPRIMYLTPGTGSSNEPTRLPPLISTEKQCGGDIVTGTHLPEGIQGQLLTGRFKSRTVVRYEFIDDGAGFSANVLEPIIKSKHPNFRPVDVKIGPDGAIYIADWYNSIINHAQHDFRDPRRDHSHGRIWRITYKDRPLVKKPKLVGLPIPELVDHLKSPEAWTRHQTRKELSERNPDEVLAAVENWVQGLDPETDQYAHHLVEAMWACQNVERVSEPILSRVMSSKSGHARSAGARVIRYWHDELSDPIGMISQLAKDNFPRTRMEAVLSAGFIPQAEAVPAALMALDHERDKFIDVAIPSTLKGLRSHWEPAIEKGELDFARAGHREFAEQFAGIGIDKRLIALIGNPDPPRGEISAVKRQFVSTPSEKLVSLVVNAVGKNAVQSDAVSVELLDGLRIVGARTELEATREFSTLLPALAHSNDAVAVNAASSFGSWQVSSAGPQLLDLLRDGDRAPEVRRAAAIALGDLSQTKYTNMLKSLARVSDIATRYHALTGLVAGDLEEAKAMIGEVLTQEPLDADPVALVTEFTRIRRGDTVLAGLLENVAIHPEVKRSVSNYHRQTGQLPHRLVDLFSDSSEDSLSLALVSENREALAQDIDRFGDAEKGEMIFRRESLACINCHGIGSVGPSIGPNLVAVGTAASTSYMIESILEPNASIAEHYENMLFTMTDNSLHMGSIVYQDDNEVIIQDSALGQEVKLPVGNIRSKQSVPSLMPAGLADQLKSREEFLDLAKFLSVLGDPGPFQNDERPFIRKWRVASATGGHPPKDSESWKPAYSKINGELPSADLGLGAPVFAKGFVEVQTPGSIMLNINRLDGLELWVDGEEISDLEKPIELNEGRKELIFGLDPSKRSDLGLRVLLQPANGSPVKFRIEGGI